MNVSTVKAILGLVFFASLALSAFSQDATLAEEDRILGKWLTEEKDGIIKMYKEGNRYHGKLVWMKDRYDGNGNHLTDNLNPDPSQKGRQLFGMTFVFDFEYDEEEERWEGGKIYNPNNGRTYRAHITMKDDNTLLLRGFLGISLIGATSEWERVE